MTGASGKTGALVVRELLQHADAFEVAANVRSDKVRRCWAVKSTCRRALRLTHWLRRRTS